VSAPQKLSDVLLQFESRGRPVLYDRKDACHIARTKLICLRQIVADYKRRPLPDSPELFAKISAFFEKERALWEILPSEQVRLHDGLLRLSDFFSVSELGIDIWNLQFPMALPKPRRFALRSPKSVTELLLRKLHVAIDYYNAETEKLNRSKF
jgi:hypothetical protein